MIDIRRLGRALADAARLDVQDCSYLYLPHNLPFTLLSHVGVPRPAQPMRVASYFSHMARSAAPYVASLLSRRGEQASEGAALFVAFSHNQREALAPVQAQVPRAVWLEFSAGAAVRLPKLPAYLASLPFFPLVVARNLAAEGEDRRAFRYVFDEYWLSYGIYLVCRHLLDRLRPRCVVVANDHVMWTRTLLRAARDCAIPSVLLQHASVTERFPPLEVDVALLEGRDAMEKYASRGPTSSRIFLVGMPRYDRFATQRRELGPTRTVGMCVNLHNTPESVEPICQEMAATLPELRWVLRPHPRDGRLDGWRRLAETYGHTLSLGDQESPFEYLGRLDAVVAGESNILLEAALLDVYPVYYDFEGKQLDWYGFCANGLCEHHENPAQLVKRLTQLQQRRPSVRDRTRYYCATVGTAFDGRSTELAAGLILDLVERGKIDTASWRPVANDRALDAHAPAE